MGKSKESTGWEHIATAAANQIIEELEEFLANAHAHQFQTDLLFTALLKQSRITQTNIIRVLILLIKKYARVETTDNRNKYAAAACQKIERAMRMMYINIPYYN